MSIIPDVPAVVVLLHLVALGAIIANSVVANHRRGALLRQLRQDEH